MILKMQYPKYFFLIKPLFFNYNALIHPNFFSDDLSKKFDDINNSLSTKIKMTNLKKSNSYEKYLFLDRLSKYVVDPNIKIKIFSLQETLLLAIPKFEAKHLNHDFIDFLFKIDTTKNFSRVFLLNLYPKYLIISPKENDNENINIADLIKILQIFSKNSIKNKEYMIKILELLQNSKKPTDSEQYSIISKQVSHLIMIFFKQNYLDENTSKYLEMLLKLDYISDFEGESLSIIIYTISILKKNEQKKYFSEEFQENLTKRFLQQNLKLVKIGNLVRTIYNLFLLDIKKDSLNFELLKRLISHINIKFKKINSFLDLSFIGCILNQTDNLLNKKVILDEIKSLSINFIKKFKYRIIENKDQSRKEIILNSKSFQICTHLLLGLYTSSIILIDNNDYKKNFEECFIFIENIYTLRKFYKDMNNMKDFKHSIFYFAKSNQGSYEFWKKMEKNFEMFFPLMDITDISYLTSSFRTNLQFEASFWLELEKRLLQILQKMEQSEFEIIEKDFKNILYIITYHQKGSNQFWKYIENIFETKRLKLKPENALKIVNYMKSIKSINNEFFLNFLKSPEVFQTNQIIPFSMNLVSFLDYGFFSQTDAQTDFINLKGLIENRLIEELFNNKINSLEIPDFKRFCEIVWVTNKLNLEKILFINKYLDKFPFEKYLTLANDLFVKFLWVVFKLNFYEKNPEFFNRLELLALEKLPDFNPSMLSMIALMFETHCRGNSTFWKDLFEQTKFKFTQFNPNQKLISFISLAKNYDDYENLFYLFDGFLEESHDISKNQYEEILSVLGIIMKKESLFVPIYLIVQKFYDETKIKI